MWISQSWQTNLSFTLTVQQSSNAVIEQKVFSNRSYKVYSRAFFEEYYYSSPLHNHTSRVNTVEDCLNVLKYDIKNVCLDDCTIIEYHTHESDDVHISYSSVRRYFVFLYRNDFPLKKRIATI